MSPLYIRCSSMIVACLADCTFGLTCKKDVGMGLCMFNFLQAANYRPHFIPETLSPRRKVARTSFLDQPIAKRFVYLRYTLWVASNLCAEAPRIALNVVCCHLSTTGTYYRPHILKPMPIIDRILNIDSYLNFGTVLELQTH